MKNWNFELVVGYAFDDAVPIGHADVSLVETFAEDFGAKPAIGLQLAQVAEQAAEGVVGRGAGTIDGAAQVICGCVDLTACCVGMQQARKPWLVCWATASHC